MFPLETKVLIAEDMANMRTMIVELCHELGFKDVIAVQDGAHAWEAMQDVHSHIGLIICDLNMPISNGMDLLKRMRKTDRFKDLPFLMVSTDADQKTVMNVIKSGADHYLVKPFNAHSLHEKLEAIYQKKPMRGPR